MRLGSETEQIDPIIGFSILRKRGTIQLSISFDTSHINSMLMY